MDTNAGRMMTPKEAIAHQEKIYNEQQAEIEAHLQSEAEEYRLMFATSIRCGHAGQDYIVIGEFDLTLCDACRAMIIKGLGDGSE